MYGLYVWRLLPSNHMHQGRYASRLPNNVCLSQVLSQSCYDLRGASSDTAACMYAVLAMRNLGGARPGSSMQPRYPGILTEIAKTKNIWNQKKSLYKYI